MAIVLNNKVGVKIATVDVSDSITAATLNYAADEIDVTSFGDTAHKVVAGLQSGTLSLSFMNDVASNDILDTLLTNFGTTVAVKMIQDAGAAVSDSNKLYSFNILVNNLTPINGSPSDISTQDVTFTLNSVVTVADTGTF
jgi:ABC-type uncharacterized transport system substrate-binding protein